MSSLLLAYDLDYPGGVWPNSVNRSYRVSPSGVRFCTEDKTAWEGYLQAGVFEEIESWPEDDARYFLAATSWRVEYDWTVWTPHHDLDNWFKSTTDGIWTALKAHGATLGVEVSSDRHVTLMRGERLLPPKRRSGEAKRDYLLATISPRVQRSASRDAYDLLASMPQGPARNAALKKLRAA